MCGGANGRLIAVVKEEKTIDKDVFARRSFTRALGASNGGCRRYRVRWRLGEQFFGVGWYMVNVRVRDVKGARSNAVGKAWFTGD